MNHRIESRFVNGPTKNEERHLREPEEARRPGNDAPGVTSGCTRKCIAHELHSQNRPGYTYLVFEFRRLREDVY